MSLTRHAVGLLMLLAFASLPSLRAQEGRLQQVREDIQDPDSPATEESPPCDRDDFSCDGSLLGYLLLSAFLGPHAVLEEDAPPVLYFPGHPYPDACSGYMLAQAPLGPDLCNPAFRLYSLAGQFSVENGNDFSGMNRVNGRLLIETASRFGVQTSWNYFQEQLPHGRADQLVLGDANLVYRFAQSEHVLMRTGVGFRTLLDRDASDFGFNFTYGGDIFPVKPLIVSAVVDLGNVGSAFVAHCRATAGIIYRRWELFTGYDYFRVGSVNLHGPLLGVRVWF